MTRFEAWLADSGTDLTVKQFPQGTRTAGDAARAVGCEIGQIVKSLVFVAGGRPVVALVSGPNRLDESQLAAVRKSGAIDEMARRAWDYRTVDAYTVNGGIAFDGN